jgi:cytochrome c oxidase subunit IV
VSEMMRKLLLSLLVGCTVIMLVSAYSRLFLYEEAYGFTQTRLLVHGFMIFLGALLAVAFIRIWWEHFSLAKAYVVSSIAAYVVINYANLDDRIASNNIERFQQTGVIDMAYLGRLSTDAAPALLRLQSEQPDLPGLQAVMDQMKLKSQRDSAWPSWNLSKIRIKK